MPSPRAQFRASDDLQQRCDMPTDARATQIAARDLDRYYTLLQRAMPKFSEPEASLIVDALNGTLSEPHTAHLLWAEIDDAIQLDQLDKKWGVDGPALVQRLRSLSPFEAMAVVDAAERFWLSPNEDGVLRAVGLIS